MSISRRRLMAVALAVSAFGAWYHNTREFPGMPLTAPEMLSAIVPAVVILVWWLVRPGLALWWVTVVWVVLLNLVVGAVLTALPLPFLPFEPEQSMSHYMTHLLYLLAQIPAIYLLFRWRNELKEPAL
jgi:hypothetical protein